MHVHLQSKPRQVSINARDRLTKAHSISHIIGSQYIAWGSTCLSGIIQSFILSHVHVHLHINSFFIITIIIIIIITNFKAGVPDTAGFIVTSYCSSVASPCDTRSWTSQGSLPRRHMLADVLPGLLHANKSSPLFGQVGTCQHEPCMSMTGHAMPLSLHLVTTSRVVSRHILLCSF